MTAKPDSTTRTPEAVLRSFIYRLGPKDQKLIRSVRAAVRKRFPTANELAYDYSSHFVIAYSPTDRGIDSVVSIVARANGVQLCFTQGKQLPDPKRLLLGSGNQTRFVWVEAARQLADPDVVTGGQVLRGLAGCGPPAGVVGNADWDRPAGARRALSQRFRVLRHFARSHTGCRIWL